MLGLSRTDSVLVIGPEARDLGSTLSPWVRQVFDAIDNPPPCDTSRMLATQGGQGSLPLRECSLDWMIFDGPIPNGGDVRSTIARALPALKPGGRVVLTFANRWGLGGVLQSRRSVSGLDGVPCHGLGHARRLLIAAGVVDVTCYAVLPDARAPRTMIPLVPSCPAAAEKFALGQAWKRASRRRAIGRRALRLLVDLRVLQYLYPHYLLVGRRPC